jgi:hypothetical protein
MSQKLLLFSDLTSKITKTHRLNEKLTNKINEIDFQAYFFDLNFLFSGFLTTS